jgi:hypothetical protein
MNLLSIIAILFIVCWVVFFEGWLFTRDRLQGKGKNEKDKGSLYFCFIGIVLGIRCHAS